MGLFDNSQKSNSRPWSYGAPFVKDAMQDIQGLGPMQFYPGRMVARMGPEYHQALRRMTNWGEHGGRGFNMMQDMYGGGTDAFGTGQGYLYDQLEAGAPELQYRQDLFDTTMANLQPGLQGAYDAAMRDPIRQFSEQTIPGINMGAAGTGTGMGTRSYNQGQIAQRGLQDRAADTASQLWTNAANQAQAAAMQGGQMDLGSEQQMLSHAGRLANMGMDMMGQGFGMGTQNLGIGLDAGRQRFGYDQSLIDADIRRHLADQQFQYQHPYNQLQAFLGPTQAFGETKGTTSTGLGNVAAGLGSAFMMGGGMPGLGAMFMGGGGGGGIPGTGGWNGVWPGMGSNYGGGWSGSSNGYW